LIFNNIAAFAATHMPAHHDIKGSDVIARGFMASIA